MAAKKYTVNATGDSVEFVRKLAKDDNAFSYQFVDGTDKVVVKDANGREQVFAATDVTEAK